MPPWEDVYTPPAINAPPTPAPTTEAGLGFVLTVANVLVTVVIVTGMIVDGRQAGNAILTGAAYFAITSIAFASLITGSASSIFLTWQHQRTERHRIDAYENLATLALHWRIESARAQQPPLLPVQERGMVDPPQTPSVTDTFVPPYADAQSAASEALAWASSLYGPDGQPDGRQVVLSGDNRGWLIAKMLGSKRGAGSRDAGLWLIHNRFILRARGGHVVNLLSFPDRGSLQKLL